MFRCEASLTGTGIEIVSDDGDLNAFLKALEEEVFSDDEVLFAEGSYRIRERGYVVFDGANDLSDAERSPRRKAVEACASALGVTGTAADFFSESHLDFAGRGECMCWDIFPMLAPQSYAFPPTWGSALVSSLAEWADQTIRLTVGSVTSDWHDDPAWSEALEYNLLRHTYMEWTGPSDTWWFTAGRYGTRLSVEVRQDEWNAAWSERVRRLIVALEPRPLACFGEHRVPGSQEEVDWALRNRGLDPSVTTETIVTSPGSGVAIEGFGTNGAWAEGLVVHERTH